VGGESAEGDVITLLSLERWLGLQCGRARRRARQSSPALGAGKWNASDVGGRGGGHENVLALREIM
jgi:hypothetical protein